MQQAENEKYAFDIAWANEMDAHACETYRRNFKHPLMEGDIRFVLHPHHAPEDKKEHYEKMHHIILSQKIDVLNGGFPCQAFSIAGEKRGFADERGNLFLSIVALIDQLGAIHGKPRCIFLENVKHLKSHDKGRTYGTIKSELQKVGYVVKEHTINTMDCSDLPQNRERMYILGFLHGEDAQNFTLFNKMHHFQHKKNALSRAEDVKKIIDYRVRVDEKYYYKKEKYPHYFIARAGTLSEDVNRVAIDLEEDIHEMYQFYQVRRGMYVRKNKSAVCPTLTANMGTGGHNVPLIKVQDGVRKLTPAETFRLQGFPVGNGYELPKKINGKSYADFHLYKQAGNAVSVPVIKLIAEHVLQALCCPNTEETA